MPKKNYKYSSVLNSDMNEIMTLLITAFLRHRQLDNITPFRLKDSIKEPKPILNNEIDQTNLLGKKIK